MINNFRIPFLFNEQSIAIYGFGVELPLLDILQIGLSKILFKTRFQLVQSNRVDNHVNINENNLYLNFEIIR